MVGNLKVLSFCEVQTLILLGFNKVHESFYLDLISYES